MNEEVWQMALPAGPPPLHPTPQLSSSVAEATTSVKPHSLRTMEGKAILKAPGSSCRARCGKTSCRCVVCFTQISCDPAHNQQWAAGKEV